MFRYALRQGQLALLLLMLALPAVAQNNHDGVLFQVSNVQVDVAAENAATARDQAIAEGQRLALQQLMERLGSTYDISPLDGATIAALVQDFEIVKEKASAVRYLATLNVRFKPDPVRDMLAGKAATYTDTRSPPVLVLPVVQQGGRNILWEEVTPWYEAWAHMDTQESLVPLIVPPNDLTAASTISAKDILSENREALAKAASGYGASGIIVPLLQLDDDGTKAKRLQLLRFGANGVPTGGSTMNLTDAPLTLQIEASAKEVRDQLAKAWMVATQKPAGPSARMLVNVPISDVLAWQKIQRQLMDISAIDKVQVIAFTRNQVVVELAFQGELYRLQEQLQQSQLTLGQSRTDGTWHLVGQDVVGIN